MKDVIITFFCTFSQVALTVFLRHHPVAGRIFHTGITADTFSAQVGNLYHAVSTLKSLSEGRILSLTGIEKGMPGFT